MSSVLGILETIAIAGVVTVVVAVVAVAVVTVCFGSGHSNRVLIRSRQQRNEHIRPSSQRTPTPMIDGLQKAEIVLEVFLIWSCCAGVEDVEVRQKTADMHGLANMAL